MACRRPLSFGAGGIEVRVLGRPMPIWRTMPAGMLLRSSRDAKNMIELHGDHSIDAFERATESVMADSARMLRRLRGKVQARVVPDGAQDRIAARCIRPIAATRLPDRLGDVTLTFGRSIAAARAVSDEVELRLDEGGTRRVDHLLLGSGYRIDIAPAAWSFGPIMRFVSGSWFASRALAEFVVDADRSSRGIRPASASPVPDG